MSAIALNQANQTTTTTAVADIRQLSVVESIEQDTHPAGEALTASNRAKLNSTGKWVKAAVDDVGTYLIIRTVTTGESVTGIRKGVVDGLNVSALAYGAKIYTAAAGAIDTATSTNAVVCGSVVSAHAQLRGTAADKLVRVDMP